MRQYGFDEPTGRWIDVLNEGDPNDETPEVLWETFGEFGETWAEIVFRDAVGFCDCVDTTHVLPFVAEYLRGMWGTYGDDGKILQFDHDSPLHVLISALCDAAGLTTHGGNIGGSWVEPAGQRWLFLYHRDHEMIKQPLTEEET